MLMQEFYLALTRARSRVLQVFCTFCCHKCHTNHYNQRIINELRQNIKFLYPKSVNQQPRKDLFGQNSGAF